MNIEHIEEFIYLAETLSFTKTAKHFYTSRSVISRRVASLESELGVRLLDRDRHNVSLTKEGEAFCREARVLVKSYGKLLESTRLANDDEDQIVRIGYLRNASRPFIMDFAEGIKDAKPNLTFAFMCMNYDELCRAMEEGELDIAFAIDFAGRLAAACDSIPVYEDEFFVVMGKGNPLAASEQDLVCADLEGAEVLVSGNFACAGFRDYLAAAFGEHAAQIAFTYGDDTQNAQLRLKVEECVALRSGRNVPIAGEGTTSRRIADADLTFCVEAYYAQGLSAEAREACETAIAECRRALA